MVGFKMVKKRVYVGGGDFGEMVKKKSETDNDTNCPDDIKLINCLIDMLIDVDDKVFDFF